MHPPAAEPLPIEPVLPQLAAALRAGRNAVLQAPPGAGKTTRVPLALLDADWLAGRRIVMLEPRRLAARGAAHRMAASLGEAVGETVGYRIRLDTRVGPRTRIEVVTEGILTRLLQDDPSLEHVGLVIFDEFHERSLHADLGLALCLESQAALREDLRLLVMSATLDGARVAALLGDAPVITSEGRSHPVDIRYAAPGAGRRADPGLAAEISAAIARALQQETGSLLVFLPGAREIRQVEHLLGARLETLPEGQAVDIAPLHGNLPQRAQDRAIQPSPAGRRKVVLSSAIAETSLTIEGIRVVIDAGLMRVPRFDPRSGMTRLATVRVTRASAAQRCGRAGRLAPGVCYRLWSEDTQATLAPYTAPEILEADLAPLALELARWGAEPARLAWLDPPPPAAYAQARELLGQLGALDGSGRLTPHGQAMAGLPLHPRLAHLVLEARALGQGALGCELAALLAERDIVKGGQRDADVSRRVELLRRARGERLGPDVDRSACHLIGQAARQCQRQLGLPAQTGTGLQDVGLLLAFAYPDRIAQRRAGAAPRYRLANGRGACFVHPEPLGRAEYLVAAQLEGDDREARIVLGAPVPREALLDHFGPRIENRAFVAWDEREQAVQARQQRRLGALVLSDEPLARPEPDALAQAMLAGIRQMGLGCLSWTKGLRAWQARVLFLHRLAPADWPDVSDAALLAGLEHWLAPFLGGASRRAHLAGIDLHAALSTLLPWDRQRLLEAWAPTHLTVPSGSRLPIDYSHETPVLAVRLQEMFGQSETPRIAGGAVSLLLHLLSPAGRPVQVTRDLASFWANTYPDVKKDLKGRYPKHYWPDDPLRAEPTRRAKPRA